MRAVAIKCPNCGADIRADGGSETATCAYCGTTAYVQRRSRVLQIPRPIPPQHQQKPVVTPPRGSGVALVAGLVLVIMGVGVAMVFGGRSCANKAMSVMTATKWDGVNAVILTDVNGDGTLDAIGRLRVLDPAQMFLGAFDGATGKRLWKSAALGPRDALLNTPSGLADGVVLIGAGPGEVVAVAVADGSIKWKIRLSEKIEAICAGASKGTAVVETADKKLQAIALANGAIQGPVDGPCKPLPTDRVRTDGPDRVVYSWANDHRDLAPRKLQGIDADEAVHDPRSGVTIAVGHKKPGTRVPMVAGYEPGNDTPIWTALVPAGDPLKAYEDDPTLDHVSVDGDAVAVAYKTDFHGTYRVTLLGARDGKRRWDVPLSGHLPLGAVRLAPKHLFVSRWNTLYIFDRATGRLLHTVD